MEKDTQTSIDGTLENWKEMRNGSFAGHVYGDAKGRFMDGTYIYTSTVLQCVGDDITTRNSTYKLGERHGK